MFRTALRNLAAHKLRLLATGLAVTLGVSFMVGTLVLTDTLGNTLDTMFADAYANTDAVVRADAAFEDPNGFGDQRGRIDASLLDAVGAVEGVTTVEGDVWGFAQLVDTDGDPVGNPGAGPPTVGANWYDSEINSWTLAAGRGPRADDEVVLDVASAEKGGYEVGDRATILVRGAPIQATVVGTVRIGGADTPGGASFMLFTTAAAQRYVGEPGKFDSISVAGDNVSQAELARRIGAVLPDRVEVVTGQTVTEENQDALQRGLSFFNTFMLIFAVIALLVGGFIIFNTFSITVAQRTKENALLRAIGASRRQILTSVLVEAAGVGIVASVIGLGAGVVVAAGLKAMLDAFGFGLPPGAVVFTGGTALVSFVAGAGITIVAAVSPARKAGKVPPIAAMRDVVTSSVGYGSKERAIIGLAVLAAGAGALLYGLLATPSSALSVVGLGVLLVFFGVSVLGRTVSLPLSRTIGAPLPRLRGIAGQLARENAMRNPKRTATTASALMIGVGLVAFITIFAASTKASFGKTVDQAVTGDFIVTAGQFGMGGLSPTVAERLNTLPEVEAAGGVRFGFADINGSPTEVLAVDPVTFDIVDVEPRQGSPADLGTNSIAVFEDVAADNGLSVGDQVPVIFKATGLRLMRVDLIYGENQPAGDWLLGTAAFNANYPAAEQLDMQVFVKKAGGVPAAAALRALEAIVDPIPGAQVLDRTEYKADQMAFIDQMLGLVYAMLGLAILIGLIGIGNTLALSIVERTRELGVMRAVGMTRRQLRSTIRWESVIISLQGTVLGLLIGVFFGWALVRALVDEGLNTFRVPVASVAVIVGLTALAGVAAAVLPARRAARLDVLRAVVTE